MNANKLWGLVEVIYRRLSASICFHDVNENAPIAVLAAMNPAATMDERRAILDGISRKVIGCAHQVSNALGAGFLEKVYENALAFELRDAGLETAQQRRIEVRYRELLVGEFVADIVVENCVIVEVKAVKLLDPNHSAQCLNYLRGTGLSLCLLVNFGCPKATVKRIVHNF